MTELLSRGNLTLRYGPFTLCSIPHVLTEFKEQANIVQVFFLAGANSPCAVVAHYPCISSMALYSTGL